MKGIVQVSQGGKGTIGGPALYCKKGGTRPITMWGPAGIATADAGGPVGKGCDWRHAGLQITYGPVEDGGHLIPAVPYREIDPQFYRQRVFDRAGEAPGTVVVDTPSRFLYVVEPGGTAMRYGVGIGREGFAWQGDGVIHWRQA
jgi:lipoprotein-anchoring transpeptidase ErfK/SrfK